VTIITLLVLIKNIFRQTFQKRRDRKCGTRTVTIIAAFPIIIVAQPRVISVVKPIQIFFSFTLYFYCNIVYCTWYGPAAWNCLNDELSEPLLTANSFRQLLKTRLFAEY